MTEQPPARLPKQKTDPSRRPLHLRRPGWQRRLRAPLLATAERLRRATRPRRDGESPGVAGAVALLGATVIERVIVALRLLADVRPSLSGYEEGLPDDWALTRALAADPAAASEPCFGGFGLGIRPAGELLVRALDDQGAVRWVQTAGRTGAMAVAHRVLTEPATALALTREGPPLVMACLALADLIDLDRLAEIPGSVLAAHDATGDTLAARLVGEAVRRRSGGEREIPAVLLAVPALLTAPGAGGRPALAALVPNEATVRQLLTRGDVLDLPAADGRTLADWLAAEWARMADETPASGGWMSGTAALVARLRQTARQSGARALRLRQGGADSEVALAELRQMIAEGGAGAEMAEGNLRALLAGLPRERRLEGRVLAALAAVGSRELRLAVLRHAGGASR